MTKNVVCNGKTIALKDKDYVTAGGEGIIYKQNNLIYKLYHKSISSQQEKKLKYLSILNKANIVSPKDILYDANNNPVGYTMPFVDDASTLALLFASSFKKRNNITEKNIADIFFDMRSTVQYIHDNNIEIVDFNELNVLISNSGFSKSYFLDVDSYQTKDFPATAIMPSIRDYTSSIFDENTDWYSFAVLMFELYTGIHPYMGVHPKYNFKNNIRCDNIEERCKNKISVYNKDVKYPAFVKLNSIPKNIDDWFISVFEKGDRYAPPEDIGSIAIKKPTVTTQYTNTGLIETLLKEYDSDINKVAFINGQILVATNKFYYYGNITTGKIYAKEIPYIIEQQGNVTLAHINVDKNILKFSTDMNTTSEITLDNFKKITVMNNRIFVIMNDSLIEYDYTKYTKSLAVKFQWSIISNASKFFNNCMYCDNFGSAIFYLPEIKDNNKVMYIKSVKELNKHSIMDAFYTNKTLVVISLFENKYYKTIIKFDDVFISYLIIQEECQMQEINATVTGNGMLLTYDSNIDILELSASHNTDRKAFKISTDMQFTSKGNEILAFKDNKLYNVSLKK